MSPLLLDVYKRQVYQCDNDVVDNQVVNLLYENGVSAAMTMCAFTEPVSYTHLDVYKRQVRTAAGFALSSTSVRSTIATA